MAVVQERKKCWRCGGHFDPDEDDPEVLICNMCGRQYTRDGYLLRHPIGAGSFRRSDGNFDQRYGPRKKE